MVFWLDASTDAASTYKLFSNVELTSFPQFIASAFYIENKRNPLIWVLLSSLLQNTSSNRPMRSAPGLVANAKLKEAGGTFMLAGSGE
jgi:hypothetical protein